MRILSLVLAILFALRLIVAHEPLDIVQTVVLSALFGLNAWAPQALYDGRVSAWEQAHPVLGAMALFLFLGVLLFNALTSFITPLTSALITVPISAAFATWSIHRSHRKHPTPLDTGDSRESQRPAG